LSFIAFISSDRCFPDLKFTFLKVIAENLSEEEIKGLKQMFNNMDTDESGTITYDELKSGLSRLGSKLSGVEIKQLMDAVRTNTIYHCFYHCIRLLVANKHCSKIHTWVCKNKRWRDQFCFNRLMLIRVGLSIISNLLQLPCIDIDLRWKRTCTRPSNTLTRMVVG